MIKIRRMQPKDLDQVYTLGKKEPWFHVSPQNAWWAKSQLRKWVESGEDPLLVAEDNGKIVGFILAQLHKPTGKATLENIMVRKDQRASGVGSKLMKAALARLKRGGAKYICALSKTNNKVAINFALKHGFKKGYNFTWLEKT